MRNPQQRNETPECHGRELRRTEIERMKFKSTFKLFIGIKDIHWVMPGCTDGSQPEWRTRSGWPRRVGLGIGPRRPIPFEPLCLAGRNPVRIFGQLNERVIKSFLKRAGKCDQTLILCFG